MKSSVLAHGLDGLNDHQVLEVLLFYGIPNGDTNPTAHRLIDRFGSLRGVLEADYSELLEVDGIAGNTASLIKFSQMLAGRYLRSSCFENEKTLRFADTDDFRRYYESFFLGVKEEQIRALAVDDELCLKAEEIIQQGTVSKVRLEVRKMVDFALRNNCDRIVMAHNHPNGAAMASSADIVITNETAKVLNKLDIMLLDHVIAGRTGCISLRAARSDLPAWGGAIKIGG